MFNSQVKILNVKIKERMDELVFNVLPEDPGHLITIKLSYWVFDFDFLESKAIGHGGPDCSCNTL